MIKPEHLEKLDKADLVLLCLALGELTLTKEFPEIPAFLIRRMTPGALIAILEMAKKDPRWVKVRQESPDKKSAFRSWTDFGPIDFKP